MIWNLEISDKAATIATRVLPWNSVCLVILKKTFTSFLKFVLINVLELNFVHSVVI